MSWFEMEQQVRWSKERSESGAAGYDPMAVAPSPQRRARIGRFLTTFGTRLTVTGLRLQAECEQMAAGAQFSATVNELPESLVLRRNGAAAGKH